METQSQDCCAPGEFYNDNAAPKGCDSCPQGYVSKFGEKYCNACNVCKKEYSAAGDSYCKTCGSSPGEYWKQQTGAVTGDCISCPTGKVLPAEKTPVMASRRLQIPGGDSESDNYMYNQRKLAEKVEMKTECDLYVPKICNVCDGKPHQQQRQKREQLNTFKL